MDELRKMIEWLERHVDDLQEHAKKYPSDFAEGKLVEAKEILDVLKAAD